MDTKDSEVYLQIARSHLMFGKGCTNADRLTVAKSIVRNLILASTADENAHHTVTYRECADWALPIILEHQP